MKICKQQEPLRQRGFQKQASLIIVLLLSVMVTFTSAALAEQEAEELMASTLNAAAAEGDQVLPEPEKPQQGDTQVVVQVRDGWQYTYHQVFAENGTWLTMEMNQRLLVK